MKALTATVLFCSLIGFSYSGMCKGWDISERLDRMSLEKTISAKKTFLDNDAPGVIVDLSLICVDNETLFAQAQTYKSTAKKGLLPGVAIRKIDNRSEFTVLETRAGTSKIILPAIFDDFNNSIRFDLDLAIKNEVLENPLMVAMGLDALIRLSFHEKKGLIETSPMLSGSEWLIRIPTVQGDPIIEIDLHDSKVKRVFKACNWIPGQPSKNDQITKIIPQISEPVSITPSSIETEQTVQMVQPVTSQNNSSFSPSFDCEKANTDSERLICSDRDLSKLDVELNQKYQILRSSNINKSNLRAEQIEWIKTKRNSCSDKTCMAQSYRERISQLNEMYTN